MRASCRRQRPTHPTHSHLKMENDHPKSRYHQLRSTTQAIRRHQWTTPLPFLLLIHHTTHTSARRLFVNAPLCLSPQSNAHRLPFVNLVAALVNSNMTHTASILRPTNRALLHETSKYRPTYYHFCLTLNHLRRSLATLNPNAPSTPPLLLLEAGTKERERRMMITAQSQILHHRRCTISL